MAAATEVNSLMGIYFLALARGKGRFYSTNAADGQAL